MMGKRMKERSSLWSETGPASTPDWTYQLDQSGAFLGFAVTTAGDVNGDGFSDIVVSAPYYDNGQTNEGAVFAFYGTSNGLSTTLIEF